VPQGPARIDLSGVPKMADWLQRCALIVALARRLLIALWRYATQGVLPEDASLKAAV
jgi:hypothetical protein